MAIIKRIAMLLHEHGKAMQNKKYGVTPRPVAVDGPSNGCSQVESLPDLDNGSVICLLIHERSQ